jgi:hypothetical protein
VIEGGISITRPIATTNYPSPAYSKQYRAFTFQVAFNSTFETWGRLNGPLTERNVKGIEARMTQNKLTYSSSTQLVTQVLSESINAGKHKLLPRSIDLGKIRTKCSLTTAIP